MLAKLTTKNQLTLPKKLVAQFGEVEYFEVSSDGESIVLRPLRVSRADEVREHLSRMGIDEGDVASAIAWSRRET
jgi:hypothetical protein